MERRRLILAAILIATAAAYLPFVGHPFQYDDLGKIVENPRLADPGSYLASFGRPGYSEDTTRLLPNLTFCADYALFGLRPAGWHLTNLLFHLVNVWLVLRLGRALLKLFGEADPALPLLAAALFGLHPLNSEAVLYCNARPNVMAAGFMIATVLNALRAVEAPGVRRWALTGATLIAGLLCKEVAAAVLLLIPLLLYWRGGDLSRLRKPVAGLAAAALLIGALTGALSGVAASLSTGGARSGHWLAGLGLTVLTQSQVFVRYMGLILVPWPGFLNVCHPILSFQERGAGSLATSEWAIAAACTAALAAALGAAFAFRRRVPVPTIGFVWLFVAQSTTFLFPRNEAMVEYRTYAGMAGACIALAWGLRRFSARVRVPAWAALILVAALGAGVVSRGANWSTQKSLWAASVAQAPGSRACVNLAGELRREGRTPEAIVELQRAIALDPAQPIATTNLGLILVQFGHAELAHAHFTAVTRRFPDWFRGHYGLGLARMALNRPEEAGWAFRRAMELAPDDGMTQINLAIALLATGRAADAEVLAEGALRTLPRTALAWLTLGKIQQARDHVDAAAQSYGRALQLAPDYSDARDALGQVFEAQGRGAEARREYETGLAQDPRSAELHRHLGDLLKRQGAEAEGQRHLDEADRCDRQAEEQRRQLRGLIQPQ